MNDRIRQLAEQANEAFYQQMGVGADRGTFYFDGFVKKFAELLVLECADLFDDEPESKTRYSGIACRGMIKSYFGVE